MKKLLLILLCLPMIGFGQCVSGNCENGYGTYTDANGDEYAGEYKDGLLHGIGAYTFNDGKLIQEGLWEMGEIIIKLEDIYLSKDKYIKLEDIYRERDVKELNPSDINTGEIFDIVEEDDDEVFMVAETMPKFKCMKFKRDKKEYCGELGLMKYIQKNVKYPPIAMEYNITGKVYVSFIVDKSGSVTNVKIVRGVDKNLDAEALRVVRSLPKYKPGFQRGKTVRVMFTIPINFTLN